MVIFYTFLETDFNFFGDSFLFFWRPQFQSGDHSITKKTPKPLWSGLNRLPVLLTVYCQAPVSIQKRKNAFSTRIVSLVNTIHFGQFSLWLSSKRNQSTLGMRYKCSDSSIEIGIEIEMALIVSFECLEVKYDDYSSLCITMTLSHQLIEFSTNFCWKIIRQRYFTKTFFQIPKRY